MVRHLIEPLNDAAFRRHADWILGLFPGRWSADDHDAGDRNGLVMDWLVSRDGKTVFGSAARDWPPPTGGAHRLASGPGKA